MTWISDFRGDSRFCAFENHHGDIAEERISGDARKRPAGIVFPGLRMRDCAGCAQAD